MTTKSVAGNTVSALAQLRGWPASRFTSASNLPGQAAQNPTVLVPATARRSILDTAVEGKSFHPVSCIDLNG
jgi:hypothetical protein